MMMARYDDGAIRTTILLCSQRSASSNSPASQTSHFGRKGPWLGAGPPPSSNFGSTPPIRTAARRVISATIRSCQRRDLEWLSGPKARERAIRYADREYGALLEMPYPYAR